jgi:hypothetical protein
LLYIRIGFYAELDPDPWNKTNADPYPDPDPGQTLRSQKVKKHTYEGAKDFLKGRKPGLCVNFGQFRCSWIRIGIRIPNTDPDQGQPHQYGFLVKFDAPGSGSKTTKSMRILLDPDPQHWLESS